MTKRTTSQNRDDSAESNEMRLLFGFAKRENQLIKDDTAVVTLVEQLVEYTNEAGQTESKMLIPCGQFALAERVKNELNTEADYPVDNPLYCLKFVEELNRQKLVLEQAPHEFDQEQDDALCFEALFFYRDEFLRLYIKGEVLLPNDDNLVPTTDEPPKGPTSLEALVDSVAKDFVSLVPENDQKNLQVGQLVTVMTDFYEESNLNSVKTIKIYAGEIGVILDADKAEIKCLDEIQKYKIEKSQALVYFDKKSIYDTGKTGTGKMFSKRA